MKCSGTHFMTDELSSRVEGQLDRTMYKAPVIVISPCAYCLLSCVVGMGFACLCIVIIEVVFSEQLFTLW